jgi:uncharacterized membrane protein
MTPTLDPAVVDRLSHGGTALYGSVAVILVVLLNMALVGKILLRSSGTPSRRDAVRSLDVVVIPLLVLFAVFIATMVERLGLLA